MASDQEYNVGTLADIPKNTSNDIYRVRTREWKGQKKVDIRTFYKDKTTGEYIPTRQGISLDLQQLNAIRVLIPQFDLFFDSKDYS